MRNYLLSKEESSRRSSAEYSMADDLSARRHKMLAA